MTDKRSSYIKNPYLLRSFFKREKGVLTIVTLTGLIYNVGLALTPVFEGKLIQSLYNITQGIGTKKNLLTLAFTFVLVVCFVQLMRYFKRFYVRRFANNVNRDMKKIIFNNIVYTRYENKNGDTTGDILTKALSDVDSCVEGMRKFTTEVFDTGVVMIAYIVLLFIYDYKLTLICMIFLPIAFIIAQSMKRTVSKYSLDCKNKYGSLCDATLSRVSGEMTYRAYGCVKNRNEAYDNELKSYRSAALRVNILTAMAQPLFVIISMVGVIFVVWLGYKNVTGTGNKLWDIAAFTAYLTCYASLSQKVSKAAHLFNSMQQADVSWKRILPFMKTATVDDSKEFIGGNTLTFDKVSISVGNKTLIDNLCFTANKGEMIGICGPIASGKTLLGKAIIGEYEYSGIITVDKQNISSYRNNKNFIGYLGHIIEIMSDTIENNILLGNEKSVDKYLQTACLKNEVKAMSEGEKTQIGSHGATLSGGQQSRIGLARLFAHDCAIAVLDDPFSAVDKKTENELFDSIKNYAENRIVFIISHRLELFDKLDKVIWLTGDKPIVATHNTLLKTVKEYKLTFDLQTNRSVDYNEK